MNNPIDEPEDGDLEDEFEPEPEPAPRVSLAGTPADEPEVLVDLGNDAAPEDVLPEPEILKAQVIELADQLLRARAETENVRKRAERERADALKYGITNFARDAVAVADNLRRAIDSVSEEARASSEDLRTLISGIELTEREMEAALVRHGITPINPMGEKFDPNLHQAVFEVPDTGEANGTVVQVMQTGYVIDERLLRPAMVGIAKNAKGGGGGPSAGAGGGFPGSTIDTKA